jgi:2-(1,2-epoxy-1,2-dihydrophenyl)acetyl-CoA isomerase
VPTIDEPTTLLLERVGAVQWIRLNRPESRNGINFAMRDELTALVPELDADHSVRAIVITGAGTDFCTGGDLTPGGDRTIATRMPATALDYRSHVEIWQRLFQALWELETPVVSAVNGTTAGAGWMLALLADLVVAAEGARWTHVFARRGMVPHGGDGFFLPRILPFHRLNEVALLPDGVTSETLHEWGVVNRLVPADHVEATAADLAERLAAGPTRSLGMTKRLYRRSLVSDMATSFAEEAAATALISQTSDRIEGVKALLEGRKPDFTGT